LLLNNLPGENRRMAGRIGEVGLGGLAEFEKELTRARTSEGRERAKARGVKLGRKPKRTEHQKREAIKRRDKRQSQYDFAPGRLDFVPARAKQPRGRGKVFHSAKPTGKDSQTLPPASVSLRRAQRAFDNDFRGFPECMLCDFRHMARQQRRHKM
jgi:hypothetical protein